MLLSQAKRFYGRASLRAPNPYYLELAHCWLLRAMKFEKEKDHRPAKVHLALKQARRFEALAFGYPPPS